MTTSVRKLPVAKSLCNYKELVIYFDLTNFYNKISILNYGT